MKLAWVWPLFLVAACAPMMSVDATHLNGLPPGAGGRSFVVQPQDDQVGSVEFLHDAGLVAAALEAKGLHPAPAGGPPADVVVVMRYGVAGSTTEVRPTDWDDGRYRGPGFWGTGYGWWPDYERTVVGATIYKPMLAVDMLDGPAWRAGERRVLFRGRAVGRSEVSDVNPAMPALVRGVFAGFPGVDP